jgi:hypothetical protein
MDVLLGNDYFEEILRTQNPFRPEGQLLRISWQEGPTPENQMLGETESGVM